MGHFPLFVDLSVRTAVVAGGSDALAGRVRLLLSAGARVNVFASELCAELAALAAARSVRHVDRGATAEDFEGAAIAFVATGDEAEDTRIAGIARRAHVPVNVADRPALCTFIMPAVTERGPVTVAVSTGGASPALARNLRARIDSVLPQRTGALADFAARFRATVRAMIPKRAERRLFWDEVLAGPVAEAVLCGDEVAASTQMLKRLNALGRPQFSTGTVYLVGAGPGDAYLLTVKVLDVLSRTDVIVHDRLVGANVLDRARRAAIRIYAGKSAGHHTMTQEEINALLLQHARAERTVVRLKGGDPFLFACGGEETDSLQRYGIAVEVVPGVSSAFPCAARVGILLTHRDLASGVHFVSAHPKPGGEGPDWTALAQGADTCVVFMGVAEAERVASNLIAHGLTPETPAAVIECGTLPDERILTGPLVNLAGMIARTGVKAPTNLILGETVRLSPTRAKLALRAATA